MLNVFGLAVMAALALLVMLVARRERSVVAWAMIALAVVGVVAWVPGVSAQEVEPTVADTVLALTVQDVVSIATGALALVISVIAVVVAWLKQPVGQRQLNVLDAGITSRVDGLTMNGEYMRSVERLVDGLNRQRREELREIATMLLDAAKWVPGSTDDALARFMAEATDGVPAGEKKKKE